MHMLLNWPPALTCRMNKNKQLAKESTVNSAPFIVVTRDENLNNKTYCTWKYWLAAIGKHLK